MPSIEILEKTPNGLETQFLLKDSTPAFANSLRRTIIAEVPTLAISEVIVLENSCPLYDEILAHRLGLIPLTTPLAEFNFRDACTCNGTGCGQCEVNLELQVEGQQIEETVYSESLKSPVTNVHAVLPNIPLLKLSRNQKVHLQCIARLGRGRLHARWQPVSTISYKFHPVIEIDKEKCILCQECVKECPQKILEIRDEVLECIDLSKCILCDRCKDSCQYNAIKAYGDEKNFIFKMESTGALSLQQILTEAMKIMAGYSINCNELLDQSSEPSATPQ